MIEDYYNHNQCMKKSEKYGLIHINQILNSENKSLADFRTMPQIDYYEEYENNEILIDVAKEEGNLQYKQLNEQQKKIVDQVLNSVNNSSNDKSSNIFCIDI